MTLFKAHTQQRCLYAAFERHAQEYPQQRRSWWTKPDTSKCSVQGDAQTIRVPGHRARATRMQLPCRMLNGGSRTHSYMTMNGGSRTHPHGVFPWTRRQNQAELRGCCAISVPCRHVLLRKGLPYREPPGPEDPPNPGLVLAPLPHRGVPLKAHPSVSAHCEDGETAFRPSSSLCPVMVLYSISRLPTPLLSTALPTPGMGPSCMVTSGSSSIGTSSSK